MSYLRNKYVRVPAVLALLLTINACTLLSTEKSKYKTLAETVNVVELARHGYSELYKQGKIDQEVDDQVKKYHAMYKLAMTTAITASMQYDLAEKEVGKEVLDPKEVNAKITKAETTVNDLLSKFSEAGLPTYQKLQLKRKQ